MLLPCSFAVCGLPSFITAHDCGVLMLRWQANGNMLKGMQHMSYNVNTGATKLTCQYCSYICLLFGGSVQVECSFLCQMFHLSCILTLSLYFYLFMLLFTMKVDNLVFASAACRLGAPSFMSAALQVMLSSIANDHSLLVALYFTPNEYPICTVLFLIKVTRWNVWKLQHYYELNVWLSWLAL